MRQFSYLLKGIILLLPLLTIACHADDKLSLEQLLNEFLSGQSAEHHERFWAEDLIYTSSSGTRFDKAFIMQGIKQGESEEDDSGADSVPVVTYSATDVDIRVHDDMAIVAFKLVAKEGTEVMQTYWNTGTFAKRTVGWQAIAWQATKIPKEE